jgi:hypothetical protein
MRAPGKTARDVLTSIGPGETAVTMGQRPDSKFQTGLREFQGNLDRAPCNAPFNHRGSPDVASLAHQLALEFGKQMIVEIDGIGSGGYRGIEVNKRHHGAVSG